MRTETVVVAGDEAGERLDRVLAARADLSRSRLKALILAGEVAIGAATIRDPGYRVKSGDAIVVGVPPPEPAEPQPENIPLDGRVRGRRHHRHRQAERARRASRRRPPQRHAGQCADRALRGSRSPASAGSAAGHRAPARQGHHRPHGGGEDRPRAPGARRPVRRSRPQRAAPARLSGHRLGRARPAEGHHRRADRPPSARPRQDGGAPGGPRGDDPLGSAGALSGIDGKPVASLLACRLETGRTHQIRVHLAHRGHPLLGDALYGPGFRTKAARLRPGAGGAWRVLADRPCMPIYWASNIRPRANRWSSDRNFRAISLVYVTASCLHGQRAGLMRKPHIKSKG